MTKLPTAKSFIIEKAKSNPLMKGMETNIGLCELLDEYANLKSEYYVTEALKAASESAVIFMPTHAHLHGSKNVSKDSILNSYPLTNIK